jgi:hypothetical protein
VPPAADRSGVQVVIAVPEFIVFVPSEAAVLTNNLVNDIACLGIVKFECLIAKVFA